ncbi:stalk domain-containing protein [Paenibacillus sp. OV219]|uniref:stalk domain-containing protein n=1 Tax=Paenibacillus sp. OV219 TaxID=1884377 RepID=UPI0008B5CFF4|nr:stalk domain-containing protein [Paenibacillus sp. OV219]SEO97124.1 PQQ-like domain-containing protein [Paenibacillus sp. OV219]
MKISLKPRRILLCALAALSLILPVAGAGIGSTVHAEGVQLNAYPSYLEKTPMTKPLWTAKIDHELYMPNGPTFSVEGNILVYLQNKHLVSADVASGNPMWTSKTNYTNTFFLHNGIIYALGEDRVLYALNAQTGKKLWMSPLGKTNLVQMKFDDKRIYASYQEALFALDPATGKKLWMVDKSEAYAINDLTLVGDTVVQSYIEQGAISHDNLYGYDAATGKEKFGFGWASNPLAVEGNQLWVSSYNFMAEDPLTTHVLQINTDTGKLVKDQIYDVSKINAEISTSSPNDPYTRITKLAMDGPWLYIGVNDVVYRYHRDADPKKGPPFVYNHLYQGTLGKWILGPSDGYMQFEGVVGLTSLSMFDLTKPDINYWSNGAVSRVDRIGGGMFIGLQNGHFLISQLSTGKTLLHGQTSAWMFNRFAVAGNIVLVQAEHQLLAYPLPAAAKFAPTHNLIIKDEKADIVVDGVKHTISPDAAFVNNQVFVPFRAMFGLFNGTISYDAATKSVTASALGKKIQLTSGNALATLDGAKLGLSEAPLVYHNTVYVPLRDISTMLGTTVTWKNHTVFISTKPVAAAK